MKTYLIIMFSAILTDNFVLSKFMGICPFLGVSKTIIKSWHGCCCNLCNGLCNNVYIPSIFADTRANGTYIFEDTIFILIIALFVQLVEMVLKNSCLRFTNHLSLPPTNNNKLCSIGSNSD